MRSGVMLCQKFTEQRLAKWKFPVLIQPKINGFRCKCNLASRTLRSSEANNISARYWHIILELDRIGMSGVNLTLDGELYKHGQSLQWIRTKVNSPELDYYVFDIDCAGFDQSARIQALSNLFSKVIPSDRIKMVPTIIANSHKAIDTFLTICLNNGYEGIILRHPSNLYEHKKSLWMMKYKPTLFMAATIIGVKEEISIDGEPKNSLGALICKIPETEITFFVGSGLTYAQRTQMWEKPEQLVGMSVTIKFAELTSRGVPFHPVFVAISAGTV